MIPSRNPWYRAALAGPHEAYSRVEVWRDGVKVDELAQRTNDAPYTRGTPLFLKGGSVRATLNSRATRTLSLAVPQYLFPYRETDLLAPYGNELRAFRGVKYGNDSRDEFPIFTGPIMRARPPSLGQVTIEATDVTQRVTGYGFPAPTPSQAGNALVDEFERVVLDAWPGATFGTHSTFTATVPVLSYDGDRGQSLDNLAKAGNAFWYALADGSLVLRAIPWSVAPTTGAVVMTDGPGGTIISAFPDRDASNLYNQWTVTSDRADGGAPFWATASDTDPTSPTYVGGPFGVRTAPAVRVTGATNQGQLLAMAQQLVARTRVLTDSWSITCVPDASIELGDPLDVTAKIARTLQLVAGFTMPLDPDAQMTIDGRGLSSAVLEDA